MTAREAAVSITVEKDFPYVHEQSYHVPEYLIIYFRNVIYTNLLMGENSSCKCIEE